jgi:hypothetical protein
VLQEQVIWCMPLITTSLPLGSSSLYIFIPLFCARRAERPLGLGRGRPYLVWRLDKWLGERDSVDKKGSIDLPQLFWGRQRFFSMSKKVYDCMYDGMRRGMACASFSYLP